MDAVNPKMKLTRESAKAEPIIDEKLSPKMPQVGNMPSGKKAAKKAQIGMG